MPPVSIKAITPKSFRLPKTADIQRRNRKAMREYLSIVVLKMREYPPQKPSGSDPSIVSESGEEFKGTSRFKYKRTYRLKNGWNANSIFVSPDGSFGTATNNAPIEYAVHVQGPRSSSRQAYERQTKRSRKAGWKSITDVARETRREFQAIMNRAYAPGPGSFENE